jgi:hypothetical protein
VSPPPPPGSSSPGVHQGLASYRFASRRPVQRYAAEQRAYVEVTPVVAWRTRTGTEIERPDGARATGPDWPLQLTSVLETFKNLRSRNYLLKLRPVNARAPSP